MSFYYVVSECDAARLEAALVGVPYVVEPRGGTVVFVFPDLPIRQYAVVRKLFGGDGLPYPD